MTDHFEFIVEEPSMEAFLQSFLNRFFDGRASFSVIVHQGKSDLVKKLAGKLRAYARWIPEGFRIVILVDRDNDDCVELKRSIEDMVRAAGLSAPENGSNPGWQVATRVVVEELEAWYFGDWQAVRSAFPSAPNTLLVLRLTATRTPSLAVRGRRLSES